VERVTRCLANRFGDALRRADRHGRLRDDDDLPAHVEPDLLGHSEHVSQVGRPILIWWRADGDEDDVGTRDRRRDVGREA
jgi:hypothetical protein